MNHSKTTSTTTVPKEVQTACQSLERAIQKLLQRYERRTKHSIDILDPTLQTDIQKILQHIQHLITQLVLKRQSLQALLDYFKDEWAMVTRPSLSSSLSWLQHDPLRILQHFVPILIQCQDGLVLLTSGECRHDGDIQQANRQAAVFPSNFRRMEPQRKDGYTALYRSNHIYSGFGMDEYTDAQVGLHVQLCHRLHPYYYYNNNNNNNNNTNNEPTTMVWDDYLLPQGGQILELLLQQHETTLQAIQQTIQQYKQQMIQDIQQQLHPKTKVTFNTEDKLERMVVPLPDQKITLERRGNAFQISHTHGVLPNHYQTKMDWKKEFQKGHPLPFSSSSSSSSIMHSSSSSSSQPSFTTLPTRSSATTTMTMKMTMTHPDVPSRRRRRRVIEDSDDDDDDNNNNNDNNKKNVGRPTERGKKDGRHETNSKRSKTINTNHQSKSKQPISSSSSSSSSSALSGGLVVRVEQQTKTMKYNDDTEQSLIAIKTQMGVNAEELEAAREDLERETLVRNDGISSCLGNRISQQEHHQQQQQQQHQNHPSRQIENDAHTIQRGRRKVERLQGILQRVQSRDHVDDNEVWDARECLREAYMALGNDLLWSVPKSAEKYEQALDHFGNAGDLVDDQQAAHQTLVQSTNDNATLESRFIQRNLLLLRGQAHVNRGIALVEWSQLSPTKPILIRKLISQAIQELSKAVHYAKDMRRQAKVDQQQHPPYHGNNNNNDWVDIIVDIFKADQLESLASRWMGVALWPSQPTEAVETLDHAASFFFSHPPEDLIRNHEVLLYSLLQVGWECSLAGTTVADLACTDLETLSGPKQTKDMNSHEKGDALVGLIRKALERNARIADVFENLKSKVPSLASIVEAFQEENDLLSGKDFRDSFQEIQTWWSQIKSKAVFATRPSSSEAVPPLLRNDLFADHGLASNLPVTRRFIVSDGARKRNRQTKQSTSSQFHWKATSHFSDAVRALDDDDDDDHHHHHNSTTTTRQYRKWGDELLPQQVTVNPETGETISKPLLPYPSVAPEMPPEIRVVFEELQNRRQGR